MNGGYIKATVMQQSLALIITQPSGIHGHTNEDVQYVAAQSDLIQIIRYTSYSIINNAQITYVYVPL